MPVTTTARASALRPTSSTSSCSLSTPGSTGPVTHVLVEGPNQLGDAEQKRSFTLTLLGRAQRLQRRAANERHIAIAVLRQHFAHLELDQLE